MSDTRGRAAFGHRGRLVEAGDARTRALIVIAGIQLVPLGIVHAPSPFF